ncbi:MAG: hypothetical protein F4W89_07005 [Acidobacteria bacterium]|nr:hypothetical protein [Acidobacteriota bacterium]
MLANVRRVFSHLAVNGSGEAIVSLWSRPLATHSQEQSVASTDDEDSGARVLLVGNLQLVDADI